MKKHGRLLIPALALALVIVGCTSENGGSGNDDTPATTDSSASTSTAPNDGMGSTTTEASTGDTVPEETTTTTPSAGGPVDEEGSVQGVIAGREDLSNLASVIAAWLETNPGNEGVFRNPAGITVFAPNNDGLSAEDADALIADLTASATFLSEHLMVGVLTSEGLGDEVTTAMGSTYEVVDGTIGGATIVEADVEATNGVIHILDQPLVPVS